MKANPFIATLTCEFARNSDAAIAAQQKSYLRNQFEFYGLTSTQRRVIQKPFLIKEYLPAKEELEEIVKTLWHEPHREYQYFAQELAFKYVRHLEKDDIKLFEYMVTRKSWWDTVDFIAVKLMGRYFQVFPDQKRAYALKWVRSDNMWLKRSALLFQLKYKGDLDTELLSELIHLSLGSTDFFINKAVGWVLREYSRTNAEWVREFVNDNTLSNLSKREALRLM